MRNVVVKCMFVQPTDDGSIEILPEHLLAVTDAKGNIEYFAPCSDETLERFEAGRVVFEVDLRDLGCFVVPGFVDTHLHAPQYANAGRGLDKPLMAWLEDYTFPTERRLDQDEALARAVYEKLVDRLHQQGTTAVSFFGTIALRTNMILAEICQDKGLRAHIGKVNMDINSPADYVETTEESLTATRKFILDTRRLVQGKPEHERLVEPVITPRFVPTCSGELLQGLSDLAMLSGCRVQSHLSESAAQVQLSKDLWDGRDDCATLDHVNTSFM